MNRLIDSPNPLQYDKALMDIFMNEFDIPLHQLQAINRVRCHYAVVSVADIATGDGRNLLDCFIQGEHDGAPSQWDWHTERPCASDFAQWHSALEMLFRLSRMSPPPIR